MVRTYYETYYGKVFEKTEDEVKRAEKEFIKELYLKGEVELRLFYELLGLPDPHPGFPKIAFKVPERKWERAKFIHGIFEIDDDLEFCILDISRAVPFVKQ